MKLKNPNNGYLRINHGVMWIEAPEGYQLTDGLVWNKDEQYDLHYHGKPCVFTDKRFSVDGMSFPATIHFRGRNGSVKASMRRIRRLKGLKKGMEFKICSKWVGPKDIVFTVEEDGPEIVYKTDEPALFAPTFDLLGGWLRDEGWNVEVTTDEGVKCALAYGNGKMAAWSEGREPVFGNWYGCDDVLWDKLGSFCKLSRCEKISKDKSPAEINAILNDNA